MLTNTKMLPNVQRAKVESKSQPQAYLSGLALRCYQMYKELKLKANHNRSSNPSNFFQMLPNVQRAKVESKSQLRWATKLSASRCYQMYKELKLKANHNNNYTLKAKLFDVTKCTKS